MLLPESWQVKNIFRHCQEPTVGDGQVITHDIKPGKFYLGLSVSRWKTALECCGCEPLCASYVQGLLLCKCFVTKLWVSHEVSLFLTHHISCLSVQEWLFNGFNHRTEFKSFYNCGPYEVLQVRGKRSSFLYPFWLPNYAQSILWMSNGRDKLRTPAFLLPERQYVDWLIDWLIGSLKTGVFFVEARGQP